MLPGSLVLELDVARDSPDVVRVGAGGLEHEGPSSGCSVQSLVGVRLVLLHCQLAPDAAEVLGDLPLVASRSVLGACDDDLLAGDC